MRLIVILTLIVLLVYVTKNKIIAKQNIMVRNILNNAIPICITNRDFDIILANDTYWQIFGDVRDSRTPVKCYNHRPGKSCHTADCALKQIFDGKDEFVCESIKKHNGDVQNFIVTARPFRNRRGQLTGVVESFQEITELKKLEQEKTELILQLRESLNKVKVLSGLVPICAGCKKIRDDQGFWNHLESYISRHSDAEFSHGLCPDCALKYYPELTEFHEKTPS
jgi:PAS domain S-box-containing protein